MSHGVQLRNASGDVFFDTNFTTWNFLSYIVAPANESVAWEVPAAALMSEINIQRAFLDAPLGDQESYAHTVGYLGTSFTAGSGKVRTAIFILGR